MTAVHQLVPSMGPGDATSQHTLLVQRALRMAGLDSEIYALAVHPALAHRVHLADRLPPSRTTGHLLYQVASVSPLADLLFERHERLAINFHNLTPPAFFAHWDPHIALALRAAEVQVRQVARLGPLGICDSATNAGDLGHLGVTRRVVAPVLMDLDALSVEPDRATADRLAAWAGDDPVCVFVGTVSPHKAQHELLQMLVHLRSSHGLRVRLALVGRPISPSYAAALDRHVDELGLRDVVTLAGPVDHRQLVAHYRAATVFVSASRHEGFGVPLVEAMACDLPVVARSGGAVAETVGTGGLVLAADAGPVELAVAVAQVVTDLDLRHRLVTAGRRRAELFSLPRTTATMVATVGRWLAEGTPSRLGRGRDRGQGDR